MKNKTIAFIGGGHMTFSLVGGLIKEGYSPENIWVSNPGEEKRANLRARFAINVTPNNLEAAKQADVIVISVKPAVVESVCHELSGLVKETHPLIISVAAGIASNDMASWLKTSMPIIRSMPNLPSIIGSGTTALYANYLVEDSQREVCEHLFRAVGIVTWVDSEEKVDVLTAVSGAGPAYAFFMMQAIQDGAKKMGIADDDSKLIAIQTVLGAAKMALESNESLEALWMHMALPDSVTEKAIVHFQENQLSKIIIDAMVSARQQAESLSKRLGTNEKIKGRLE